MPATLDLLPAKLDLRLYIGDDPAIQLVFWTDETKTQRLDLSAYTGWAAQIRATTEQVVNWTVDTSQKALGIITLTLDGDLLRDLPTRGNRWDVQTVNESGRVITPVGGRVALVNDETRP